MYVLWSLTYIKILLDNSGLIVLLDSGKLWILSIVSVHFYAETLLIVYITFVSFCENTKIFMYKVTTITNIIYIFLHLDSREGDLHIHDVWVGRWVVCQ